MFWPKNLCVNAVLVTAGLIAGGSLAWAGHGAGYGNDCTALHEAAFLDEPDEARQLLAHGADVNCLDVLGHTPLVTAVNGASKETFEALLAAGARIDVRTEYGQTLLAHTKKKHASFTTAAGKHYRALYGDMVVLLLRVGAAK